MACNKSCESNSAVSNNCHNVGNGYVCLIVLYILLAIIVGTLIAY